MTDSLQFLFIVYILCIGVSILTLLNTLFFVVPLQIRRVHVKNGLQQLRQKLLTNGLITLVMAGLTVFILTSRFFLSGDIIRYLNTTLIFFFTLMWFIRSVIESSIYHTQFTEDQIRIHHKIFREEQRIEERKKQKQLTKSS